MPGVDHFLGMLDEPVVLGMEHMVDGGQADILVDAAIAGDEVRVEQFVVVDPVVAGMFPADFGVAIGETVRDGIMRDVGEERVVGAERTGTSGSDVPKTLCGSTGSAGLPSMTTSSAVFGMPSSDRCR